MAPFLALLSLMPFFLAGDLLLGPLKDPDMSPGTRITFSFLLGTGFVALLNFLLSWAGSRQALVLSKITITFLAVLYLARGTWRARRRGALRLKRPDSGAIWLGLLLLVTLLLVGRTALGSSLGHDGLLFWGLKAKALFTEGYVPPATVQLQRNLIPVDYPWLVPTVEAWIYQFLGRVDEQALTSFFVLCYGLLLITFYAALRERFGRPLSTLYTALLATTPYIASIAALSGYADLPMALFVFATFLNLYRWLDHRDNAALVLAGIFSGLLVWVKRDGLIHFAIIPALLFVITFLEPRRNRLAWSTLARRYALPALLVALPWLLYRALYPLGNTDFLAIDSEQLIGHAGRILLIAYYLLLEWFAKPQYWGFLWIVFWLVSIFRWRRLRYLKSLFTWLVVVVPPSILAFAFIFVAFEPVAGHLNRNLNRQWLHTMAVGWFFIATQMPEFELWLRQRLATRRKNRNRHKMGLESKEL